MSADAHDGVPVHLRPEACFVCGGTDHADGTSRGGHRFMSNTEVAALEAAEPPTTATYPGGQRTAEAAYVDGTRGR